MSTHIGPVGFLSEIRCSSTLQRDPGTQPTSVVTLGGQRRVQLPAMGDATRVWKLGHNLMSWSDRAVLDALAQAGKTVAFVDHVAKTTNVLTPQQVRLSQATTSAVAGAYDTMLPLTGGGHFPGLTWGATDYITVTKSGQRPVVMPGQAYTGACFVRGGRLDFTPRVRLTFYDAAQANVGSAQTVAPASIAGPLQRLSVTSVAPATAVTVRLDVGYATGMALPTLTWGNTLRPPAGGAGVHNALVIAPSLNAIMATDDTQLASGDYELWEVADA